MRKLRIFMLGIVLVVSLFAIYFIFSNEKPKDSVITGKNIEEIKEFYIIARQFSFDPKVIEVNEGDLVRLNVRSEDVEHGIKIKEFDINERLKSGETKTIEFIADKKGRFSFSCSVFCGIRHGDMKGEIIVK